MAAGAKGTLPPATILPELDEYPAFDLFKRLLPQLVADDPELGALLAAPATAPARQLERAIQELSQRWARGELTVDGVETFAQFDARVLGALDHVTREQGRGKTVALVTSGGPVSIAMRRALALTEGTTLRVMWTIANTSLTEFRYREGELSLFGFNHLPHVPDRNLVTYR
jgi:broad specificity phosphatase PhoE